MSSTTRRDALDSGYDRSTAKGDRLARQNYQFEKRQRDLAKKRKQEEKRLRKQQQKEAQANPEGDPAAVPPESAPDEGDPNS